MDVICVMCSLDVTVIVLQTECESARSSNSL